MKAIEGKLGRVFLVQLEDGDPAEETLNRFAREKGIAAAQVSSLSGAGISAIISPDTDGNPEIRLLAGDWGQSDKGELVVQEVLGLNFRRITDPTSGRATLTKIVSTKTRVMEKPAPAPEEEGPGTIPVYLFNAEFN